jgi:hypothetical protein
MLEYCVRYSLVQKPQTDIRSKMRASLRINNRRARRIAHELHLYA